MRLALVTDDVALDGWERDCVRALLAVDGVELVGDDASALLDCDLDVVLKLGCAPGDELARAARHGAWFYACGEGHLRTGRALCAWDVLDRSSVTEAALCRRTAASPAVEVLRHGAFKTVLGSAEANRAAVVSEAAGWAAEAARRLVAGGAPSAPGALPPEPPQGTRGHLSRGAAARLRIAEARARLRSATTGLVRHGNWNIGVVPGPPAALLNGMDRGPVEWLPRRTDGYVADPFVVQVGETRHLFCEEYRYESGRGAIGHLDLSAEPTAAPEIVLELPVHASYPCVVEDGDEIFLVPETSAAGEVALYGADDFPRGWRKVATLLEGVPGVDPTVFRHEGRWWLFATRLDAGPHHRLHAWHAERLRGPWREHAANPIKIDVRSARPGGLPFVADGELYRPAQDCSESYGGRLVINRVTALTPERFSEEAVAVAEPDCREPFGGALHTVAGCGGLTLIDGRRMIPRTGAPLRRSLRGQLIPSRTDRVRAVEA
jgi:hypothetical protein